MVGLRTQENSKFLRFWEIVQKAAAAKGKVFFLDCGEGNICEDETIECENLTGWLIDSKDADEFEKLFKDNADLSAWADFLAFTKWEKGNADITITFKLLDDFGKTSD